MKARQADIDAASALLQYAIGRIFAGININTYNPLSRVQVCSAFPSFDCAPMVPTPVLPAPEVVHYEQFTVLVTHLVQEGAQSGEADIITRAPHSLFCQLRRLAHAPAPANRTPAAVLPVASPLYTASSPSASQQGAASGQQSEVPKPNRLRTTAPSTSASGSTAAALPVSANGPLYGASTSEKKALEAVEDGPSVRVATVSEFNLERWQRYDSASDVAAKLVGAMEEAPAELRAAFRDFWVGEKASLVFLTWHRWEALRAAGVLPSAHVPTQLCVCVACAGLLLLWQIGGVMPCHSCHQRLCSNHGCGDTFSFAL